MRKLDRPVWAETPAERSGHPNVFHLPIYMGLKQRTGVTTTQAAQCMLGARTSKLTDFLLFCIKLCVPPLCLHHSQWWRLPWNGAWRYAPHPPLRGKKWMIEAAHWHRGMLRWGPPRGKYISRKAAAYPPGLNKTLAEAWIAGAALSKIRRTQANSLIHTGHWQNTIV